MKWRARWYFIKPWKKFFPTYSVLEKSVYHLIFAISVELPLYFNHVWNREETGVLQCMVVHEEAYHVSFLRKSAGKINKLTFSFPKEVDIAFIWKKDSMLVLPSPTSSGTMRQCQNILFSIDLSSYNIL